MPTRLVLWGIPFFIVLRMSVFGGENPENLRNIKGKTSCCEPQRPALLHGDLVLQCDAENLVRRDHPGFQKNAPRVVAEMKLSVLSSHTAICQKRTFELPPKNATRPKLH